MKKILLLILLACLSLTVKSSHLAGGYIYYEYIGPNHYKVIAKFFEPCNGLPFSGANICISSLSLGYSTTLALLLDTSIEIVQNHCVVGIPTNCIGGLANGIKEYTSSDTITLPAAANDWIFSWAQCCRNGQISTIQPNGIYIHATLDNLTYPVNSSPVFNFSAIVYFCQYFPYQYDNSTTDADGDSLIYSLAHPSDAVNCPAIITPVVFNLPYSATNPVASNPPAYITTNGILHFTPTMQQGGVFCVKVEEYRNGVKIGEVIRDVMFIIEPNTTGIEENNLFPFEVTMPDESHIEIVFSEPQHATQISLTDATGRKIISSEMKKGIDRMVLEIPGVGAGIYLLNVYCNGKLFSRKLVF